MEYIIWQRSVNVMRCVRLEHHRDTDGLSRACAVARRGERCRPGVSSEKVFRERRFEVKSSSSRSQGQLGLTHSRTLRGSDAGRCTHTGFSQEEGIARALCSPSQP